jgi:hypothetical protein
MDIKTMTKEKILKAIEDIDTKFDLTSDFDTDMLFHEIDQKIGLSFDIDEHATQDDSWLECFYHSNKLGKTILWDSEVGNFDDYDEVADYIIRITQEIKDFESSITKK